MERPKMRPSHSIMIVLILLLVVCVRPAYGYLDPGTGSMILQVLIGSLLGSLLAVKMFWRQIKLFVGGLFKGKDKAEQKQTSSQQEDNVDA